MTPTLRLLASRFLVQILDQRLDLIRFLGAGRGLQIQLQLFNCFDAVALLNINAGEIAVGQSHVIAAELDSHA